MKRSKHLAGRLLAMALAAAMCMGMSVTAFADEGDNVTEDPSTPGFHNGMPSDDTGYPSGMPNGNDVLNTENVVQNIAVGQVEITDNVTGTAADIGTISVHGIEPGLKVTAYRVVAPVYGNNGKFSMWKNLSSATLVDKEGAVPAGAFSKDNIAAAAMWARDAYAGAGTLADGAAAPAGGNAAYEMQCDKASVPATPVEDGEPAKGNMTGTVTYTAKVSPGAYVLLVEGGEAKVYGAMVVSLSYNGFKSMNGATLGLMSNQAFAKMQSEPTIDKYITLTDARFDDADYDDDGNPVADVQTNIDGKGITTAHSFGDRVYFDILVKNIPDYRGDNVLFTISDTMSAGLEFDGSDIQYAVFYNDAEGNQVGDKYADQGVHDIKYSVAAADIGAVAVPSEDKTSVKWTWTKDNYHSTIGKYAGCDLVIRYAAKIVDTDKEGIWNNNIGTMVNGARLDFTHNSLVAGGEDFIEVPPRHVYSFAFGIKKTAAEDGRGLPGAKYVLYAITDSKGSDGSLLFDGKGKIYVEEGYAEYTALSEDAKKLFTTEGADEAFGELTGQADDPNWYYVKPVILTTENEGVKTVKGLGPGRYYLREVEAPEGYTVNDEIYTIDIVASYAGDDKTLEGVKYTVKIDGKPVAADGSDSATEFAMTDLLSVTDTKMVALPSTGGAGTAILVAIGVIGLAAGMFVIFGSRKKEDQ